VPRPRGVGLHVRRGAVAYEVPLAVLAVDRDAASRGLNTFGQLRRRRDWLVVPLREPRVAIDEFRREHVEEHERALRIAPAMPRADLHDDTARLHHDGHVAEAELA